MSKETSEWLNTKTLVGFTAKRGNAWHRDANARGDNPDNHFTGAVPWHRVQELIGAWEILEATPTAEVFVNGEFKTVIDDTRKMLIHSETLATLGVHSKSYTVHGYEETLLRNVSNILGDSLEIGSAGLLRAGAQAWVQIETPEVIQTPAGVDFYPHLLAATSVDGSIATRYSTGVQVVVCDNTLNAALNEKGGNIFRIRHTSRSLPRLADARAALGIIEQTADAFSAQVETLTAQTVTDREWFKFLDLYVPIDSTMDKGRGLTMANNKREALTSMYRNDPRVAPWNGTAFGVVQAVNTFVTHVQTVKGATRDTRNTEARVMGKVDAVDRLTVETLGKVLQLA